MLIEKILLEEIHKINNTNKSLLDNLKETSHYLGLRDTKLLRNHFLEQERLTTIQNNQLTEVQEILNSTHFKTLTELVSHTNNKELTNAVIELKELLYNIVLTTNLNREMIEDCRRINDSQLNLIIGKKQEPTNYNFSTQSINSHLLTKFKNSK